MVEAYTSTMAYSVSFSSAQIFEGKIFGSTFEDTAYVSEDEVLPSEDLSWDLVPCEDEPRTAVAAPVTELPPRPRPEKPKAALPQATGSNNPIASSFNRPQQTQQRAPTLSALQEQKTATQFIQPAYNPINSYQAPPPAAAPFQQPAQTPAVLGPMSKKWELPPRKRQRKRK